MKEVGIMLISYMRLSPEQKEQVDYYVSEFTENRMSLNQVLHEIIAEHKVEQKVASVTVEAISNVVNGMSY